MKILLISHKFYPDVGGIEVNSELLAKKFSELGAEVHVLTWSEDSTNKFFPFQVIRNPGLKAIVKEYSWCEIVFENNQSLKLSWPVFFLKKPHVVALNTWISRMDGTISKIDKLKLYLLSKATKVIAVSKKVQEVTFPGAIVIGNPYRDELFFTDDKIKKTKDFVFLGRLVSDKGIDMCVELLNLIYRKEDINDEMSLTIIGDGEEKERLKRLVKELCLEDFVTFKGTLVGEELTRCLNEHKYILVPSRWREPFGNVAIEGIACGCLPIVSDGGGLIDAVGSVGVVFERNNLNSLYEKTRFILQNHDYEVELRKGFTNHLKNHETTLVAKKYFDVFIDAINQ